MWHKLTDKHEVVACSMEEGVRQFNEAGQRCVARNERDGVTVSTVFLCFDHGFGDEPQFFETMIFGGKHDEDRWRYATWDEAMAGHKTACALVGIELHVHAA